MRVYCIYANLLCLVISRVVWYLYIRIIASIPPNESELNIRKRMENLFDLLF